MRMVQEWRELHERELDENWGRVQRPEPVAEIEPLHGDYEPAPPSQDPDRAAA